MSSDPASDVETREPCFVIMPIADRSGYPPGHFAKVYNLLIVPAVEDAGFRPVLASTSSEAVVIHLEILSALLKAPMAICDISDLNANVMYELGVRQAFDKPVVIIKDEKTSSPFDLIPIRYQDYKSGLFYESVVEERVRITSAIKATAQSSGDSVNSLVSLLGTQAAASKGSDQDPMSAKLELIERNVGRLGALMSSVIDRFEVANLSAPYSPGEPPPIRNLGMGDQNVGLAEALEKIRDNLKSPTFKAGLMGKSTVSGKLDT